MFGRLPRRPAEPVVFSEAAGAWLVVGYEQCLAAIRQDDDFRLQRSAYPGAAQIRGRRGVQLLESGPHRALHSALLREFSRRAVIRAEPLIAAVCADRWDAFGRRLRDSPADLATGFCDDVAARAICVYLGVAPSARLVQAYAVWNRSLTPWVQTCGRDAVSRARAEAAAARFAALLIPAVRQQVHPEGMAARLNEAGAVVFADWSDGDLLDQYRLLFLAGGEGTAQLMSSVCWAVLKRGYRKKELNGVIEECLRLAPPAQLRPYRALRDAPLGGIRVRAGDLIHPLVTMANTDPCIRDRPAAFVPELATSKHLSFNAGQRFCVGAHLARSVTRLAVLTVGEHWRRLRLCDSSPQPTMQGFRFKGMRPLFVELKDDAGT